MKKNINTKILKVDASLGLVLGYAIVCKEDGEDYYDTQGDHIPEDAMLKASAEFMLGKRVLGDMHKTAEGGTVVFAFPMTTDIAKAFGIEVKKTGLMIAVKPETEEMLKKYQDGTYTGFSIGGERVVDEDVT